MGRLNSFSAARVLLTPGLACRTWNTSYAPRAVLRIYMIDLVLSRFHRVRETGLKVLCRQKEASIRVWCRSSVLRVYITHELLEGWN